MNDISFEEHVCKVEEQMGMSVIDFHKKLTDLLTPEYLAKAAANRKFLDEWLEDGNPIFTLYKSNQRELELQDGEYFIQCFDPDKPGRNELPVFWFYSNFDNLVSVWTNRTTGKQKVIWLPPKASIKKPRGTQNWVHPVTGSTKTMKAYCLGALVLNEESFFGRASYLLDMFGTYAFGVVDDPWNLNGHHMLRYSDYHEKLYDHNNIQTLDTYGHDLLRRIRKIHEEARKTDSDSEKRALETFLAKDISTVTEVEAPGKMVLIWDGDRLNPDGSYKDSKGNYSFRYGDPNSFISPSGWIVFTDRTGEGVKKALSGQQATISKKLKELEAQNWPCGKATRIPCTVDGNYLCDFVVIRTRRVPENA